MNNGTQLTNVQLAEQVSRLTAAVNQLLDAGAIARQRSATARAELEAAAQPRAQLLDVLARANGGKPGHLSTTELQKLLGATKSVIWHHAAALADEGRVIIVRGTRDGRGKRGPDVVYHADAALLT